MRVLVTGAGGQVGSELLVALRDLDVVGLTHAQLDVADREAVAEAVRAAAPDVVVHAAAWTAVDACEEYPARARRVNADGTAHVVAAARAVGARVCYVSTDYVFDGTKADPYVETDAPNPLSVYGRTKLAGERALDPDDVVVRTSWVCGRHGANMVKTILRLAAEPGPLRFVEDQRGHPTFADDLAAGIARLLAADVPGTYHMTNQGAVSWYEFAREVLEAAGHDPERVEPVPTSAMPRPAPRPANSVLENAALRAAGLPLLDDHRRPLARLVAELG